MGRHNSIPPSCHTTWDCGMGDVNNLVEIAESIAFIIYISYFKQLNLTE